MKNVTEARVAKAKLAVLMDSLKIYYSEEGQEIEVRCSAGAVIANQESKLDILYAQADKNLYDAKKSGKNRYILTSFIAR